LFHVKHLGGVKECPDVQSFGFGSRTNKSIKEDSEMKNQLKMPNLNEFLAMKPKQKAPYLLSEDGTIRSFLYSQQLTKEIVDKLIQIAEFLEERIYNEDYAKYLKSLLFPKGCILYFTQCSTRTFTSFSMACQSLGMIVEEIRDPEMSALYKGESELDTILALGYLSDLIVMRSMDPEIVQLAAYEFSKRDMSTLIISGGSGSDQHPTQALLELYTVASHLNILGSNKKGIVAFVGDLKRSRTARSLSYLLALYPQIVHVFVAPQELQIGDDILEYLTENQIEYVCSTSLDEYLSEIDVLYLMRMQDEYSATSESLRKEYSKYYLSLERTSRMKEGACIIHPLPRRAELPIEIDSDPRAKYWKAVRLGKIIRMALILYMMGLGDIEKLV